MEENTTSWKNHSFTMLVFGGIVVLCSIFFVLGMLVGRSQGQRIAEMAFADKSDSQPVAASGTEDLTLNYYSETREDKPDLRLQPAPEPEIPVISAPAAGGASTTARLDAPAEKAPVARPAEIKPAASTKAAIAKPATARKTAPDRTPPARQVFLQIMATQNGKQAKAELKKVELKGFKARIVEVTKDKVRWHRIYVGPYKESDVGLATSDLKAKGYKQVIVQK